MRHALLSLFLILLAAEGSGQQDSLSRFEQLLADAQRAQNTNDFSTAAADYEIAVKLRKDVPELWANLGLMQHETGDYNGAIKSFNQARQLNPSLYVPNLFLGIDYLHQGQTRDAVPVLLAAEKMNDHDPLPSLTLGRAYSSLGEYRLAVQQLRLALQIDPKQSSAWFVLGIAYLHQVEIGSRTMTSSMPQSPYAKALFAEALAKQSRYNEAADVYEQVLASSRQPECLESEAGLLYLRQGKADKAANALEQEHNDHPGCTLAMLGTARLKVDEGALNEAVQLLRDAWVRDQSFFTENAFVVFVAMDPDKSRALIDFLLRQRSLGRIDDGMADALTQAASGLRVAKPELIAAASHRGTLTAAKLSFQGGHYRECAETARGALAGKNSLPVELLATCAFFAGEDELASQAGETLQALPGESDAGFYWAIKANERLALDALAQFQQLEPNSARSHILLGDIYRQQNHDEDAQKEYLQALTVAPDDTAALLGLAMAYHDEGKIDAAATTAEKALLKEPDDPEINILMGEVFISRRDYLGAEGHLVKGLRAKPQMLSHVHAMLGEVYLAENRNEDAMAQLKLGIDSDRDGSLHYQLGRLYLKSGDKKDADITFAQMDVVRQKRRKAAEIALDESLSSAMNSEQ